MSIICSKNIFFVKYFLLLMLALISSKSFSQDNNEFVEGKHYRVLDEIDKESRGKIVEHFSYACIYCYRTLPVMEKIESKISNIEIERNHISFGRKKYHVVVHAWLIMSELGIQDRLHRHVFDIKHVPLPQESKKYQKLKTMDDLRKFILDQGVDATSYEKALKVVKQKGLIALADKQASRHKVAGTPTYVINGKYAIDGGVSSGVNGRSKLFNLIKYLAAKP